MYLDFVKHKKLKKVRRTGGERAITSTKITPIRIFCPETNRSNNGTSFTIRNVGNLSLYTRRQYASINVHTILPPKTVICPSNVCLYHHQTILPQTTTTTSLL
jgi:hypothetical protein